MQIKLRKRARWIVASRGEETLMMHFKAHKLTPEREFRFHDTRRWRFDFAFPDRKLAVEVEGGTYTNGRHTRGSGYEKDLEKYNTAARLGWTVLRYTTGQVIKGTAINEVLEVIKG